MPNGTYLYDIVGQNLTSIPQTMSYIETQILPIGELLTFALMVIVFIATARWGVTRAFTSATLLGVIVSVSFLIMSSINDVFVYATAVAFAISVILLYFKNETGD